MSDQPDPNHGDIAAPVHARREFIVVKKSVVKSARFMSVSHAVPSPNYQIFPPSP